ncbi:MAG TPA: hypothetical protein DIT89_16335 [Planctomycetaceae bacterium]|jgi:hypothetical protein|nr:hypothetical protein [Planctomycetaceae bacterium]
MMRTRKLMGAAVLLAAGYVAGALTQPATLSAVSQDGSSNDVGQDVLKAYHAVSKSVKELNSLLSAGGQSSTVTSGVNFFSSSVGGVNAEQDLEEGRGVDPETFAALYADLATPQIAEHIDYDELGRLRYKKNVVRIYSRERLKALFSRRDQLDVRSETAN